MRSGQGRPRRWDMITVPAYKILYSALPKAGCSSVKEALARLDPAVTLPPEAEITVKTWHRIYPTVRHYAPAWDRYQDHWRFCVVRDPAKRLMSCYTDLVLTRGALRNSPRLRASGLPLFPSPDVFFQQLDRYRRASSLVKHHSLGAHVFLGRAPARDYSRVFRTTELTWLADDLSERTGRRVTMPHGNATRTSLSVHDLKGATIDALRPFLEEEYAFLSAYYANPLGPRRHEACAIPFARVS